MAYFATLIKFVNTLYNQRPSKDNTQSCDKGEIVDDFKYKGKK